MYKKRIRLAGYAFLLFFHALAMSSDTVTKR